MFEACVALEAEYADAEAKLADPAIHADQTAARKLGKRHAELRPIIDAYRKWKTVGEDIVAADERTAAFVRIGLVSVRANRGVHVGCQCDRH